MEINKCSLWVKSQVL